MQQFQIGSKTILAVPVQPDAEGFVIDEGMLHFKQCFGPMEGIGRLVQPPPGSWQILGRLNELTIDKCFEVGIPLQDLYANSIDETDLLIIKIE